MASAPDEPIQVRPQLEAKPWGGRRLAQWGIALPPGETIGEAHLTAPEALVAGGPLAGMSLGELAARWPDRWVGERGLAATGDRAIFPLLIKLIDARENLSIQVHPGDRAAAARGLGTGKTEAHHILAADPGSLLYLGLREPASAQEFARACRRGDSSLSELLRQIPAEPGQTLLVPAGTVHAIGAGVLLYEIQQPSNVTFRLDDWGRRDAAGRPRALHHDAGLAVLDQDSRPVPISPVSHIPDLARRALLAATRYFALECISAVAGERVAIAAAASPQALTVIAGSGRLQAGPANMTLAMGETAVLPVALGATISGRPDVTLLRGWVPDLEQDVLAPARRGGTDMAAVEALGIRVGDA